MNNYERNRQYSLIKEIASYAYRDNLDMNIFINKFFLSYEAKQIVLFSDITYFNPINVYHNFIKNNKIPNSTNHDDILVIYYAVKIYLSFYYRTNEEFLHILKQLPYEDISKYYELYHTLSEERVIFMSKVRYNLKMNPVRKLRSGDNVLLNTTEDIYNLFVAKHLYLKLFNYPEIRNTRYLFRDDMVFLINDDVFLYACFSSDVNEVISDETLSHIKYNHKENILFIFPDIKESYDKDYLNNLFNKQTGIPFDKILVYMQDRILFINSGDGYREFYINITSLDEKRIGKEYRNRY